MGVGQTLTDHMAQPWIGAILGLAVGTVLDLIGWWTLTDFWALSGVGLGWTLGLVSFFKHD